MSDQEFNKLFSRQLCKYLELNNKTQLDLANYLNVSAASVSNWCKGLKTPRMDKVDAMCKYLGIKRSNLLTENDDEDEEYYLNEETKKVAQEYYENKDLALLFDAGRDASPEDLQTVHTMLLALKKKERGE